MTNHAVLHPSEIFVEAATPSMRKGETSGISAARGILIGLALSLVLWVGIYYAIAYFLPA